jgi:hypothetical protein
VAFLVTAGEGLAQKYQGTGDLKTKHKSQGTGDLSLTSTKILALLVQKYKY